MPYPKESMLQQEADGTGEEDAMRSAEEMDIEDLFVASDSEEDDELRRIFQKSDIFS